MDVQFLLSTLTFVQSALLDMQKKLSSTGSLSESDVKMLNQLSSVVNYHQYGDILRKHFSIK